MQNPVRRIVVASAALLALSISLTACGSTEHKATPVPDVTTLANVADTPVYQCSSHTKTFTVVANGGRQSYNGSIVTATDDEVHPNAKEYPQTMVKLVFSGKPLNAKHMIVNSFYQPRKTIISTYAVMQLTPRMFTQGFTLHSKDFSKGYIPLVEFCINP